MQSKDLFPVFTEFMFGPEPGEVINQEGLVETLEYMGLNPADPHVFASFKRWWSFHGGSLEEQAPIMA